MEGLLEKGQKRRQRRGQRGDKRQREREEVDKAYLLKGNVVNEHRRCS